jgi:hypothetical protein
VQQIAAPPFAYARGLWQVISQSGRDEDASGAQGGSVLEHDVEPPPVAVRRRRRCDRGDAVDPAADELASVAGDLGAACAEQVGGWTAVGAQETMHVRRRGVAWLAGVDHRDASAAAGEDQCR